MSDYDIHSCGYYCDRFACVLRQRDELRDKLFEEIRAFEGNTQTSDTQSLWRKRQSKFKPEPMIDGWPLWSGLPPPKKEWVGLTDEEIADVFGDYMDSMDETEEEDHNWDYERLIEAKLKEKNA